MIFAIASVVIAVFLLFRRKNGKRGPFIILFILMAAGFLVIQPEGNSTPAWTGLRYTEVDCLEGRATADSRRLSTGGYLLELELSGVGSSFGAFAEAGGRVLLFFGTDPGVHMGRLLSVDTNLYAADNMVGLIQRQRLSGFSVMKEPAVFTAYPDSGSISRRGWSSPVAEFRAGLIDFIDVRCSELGPEAGGLFAALFTGNRDGLTLEESSVFRRAGCSHILALSGMHLGILSGIILLLLKPLPGRKTAFILSCIIILFYLYLTGFGTSLVRAAVMYFIAGAASSFYRKYRTLDVLILSFIILVIVEPASFFTVAFQLSFLSVAGIIIIAPHADFLMRPFMPRFLGLALAASIGAQLLVSPVLAPVFGELYPAGLVFGIIAAPVVTVFIWIGIIYLITGLGPVAKAAGILYRLIFFSAGNAARFPSLNVEGFEVLTAAVCALAVTGLVCLSLYRRRPGGIPGKL